MKSTITSSPRQKKSLLEFTARFGRAITSGPVLVGLNLILLGGFLGFFLLSQQPKPGRAAEILPPTFSPGTDLLRKTPTPLPAPPDISPSPTGPISTATATPTLPASPLPTLPASASIAGIKGHKQSMPLSCEARSAVDWAAYFGTEIDEGKFFAGLPVDDNPEVGFVGDVFGSWGQIPPEDYGVHARPIAQRLREFGLNAKHIRHMTIEELKREVAAGRPVIVWVVGHVNRGTPVPYTSSSGDVTTVAKFEHTVIVIGYTETKITVMDGARIYSIYQGEFSKSWDVLENQAVVWID